MSNVILVSRPQIDFGGLFAFIQEHNGINIRQLLQESGMISSEAGGWDRTFAALGKQPPELQVILAMKLPISELTALMGLSVFPVCTLSIDEKHVMCFVAYTPARWVQLTLQFSKVLPTYAVEIYRILQPLYKDLYKDVTIRKTPTGHSIV